MSFNQCIGIPGSGGFRGGLDKMPGMSESATACMATIRSFTPADQAACRSLYVDGLMGGRNADNDTAWDIDHIEEAYMKGRGNHCWVAEDSEGRIAGMIGVQHHEEGVGEIRRLRVRPDCRRRGIGTALVEAALRFCQERHDLKVTLDTFMEREPAFRLFERFHFRPERIRTVGEKELVHFYLDLYSGNERRDQAAAGPTQPA